MEELNTAATQLQIQMIDNTPRPRQTKFHDIVEFGSAKKIEERVKFE